MHHNWEISPKVTILFSLFLLLKIFTYFITNIIISNDNNFALKHIFTHSYQILHIKSLKMRKVHTHTHNMFFFEIEKKCWPIIKCITLRKSFFFFTFLVTRVLIRSIFIVMFISNHYFSAIIIYIYTFIFLKVSCFFLPTFHLPRLIYI